MIESYLRIQLPLPTAMARFIAWMDRPLLAQPRLVPDKHVIGLAFSIEADEGELSFYAYECGGWSFIHDVFHHIRSLPTAELFDLAGADTLVYGAYDDTVPRRPSRPALPHIEPAALQWL